MGVCIGCSLSRQIYFIAPDDLLTVTLEPALLYPSPFPEYPAF